MKAFEEIKGRDPGAIKENAWFDYCRAEAIPFITVKSRTKYADVHWDYICYPTEVDKILKESARKITDGAIAIFHKYANEKSSFEVSSHLVWFRKLEIDKARLAAGELFVLVREVVGNVKK